MSAEASLVHPVIRRLGAGDLEDIMAIETAAYPFPWTHGIFSECLKIGYGCFGLQAGADLVGYSIQNWAADESHLLNLCIHPDWQRRGLGGMLLEHAIGVAKKMECEVMFLEVRPSNPAAAALYRRRGFDEVGRRPAYYRSEDGREDAIVMRLGMS